MQKKDNLLNVRVAKALGKKVDCNGEEFTNDPAGCSVPLDDYSNDLVAAMGALEEYCSIDGINFGIARCDNHKIPRGTFIFTLVTIGKETIHTSPHKSLTQAICETIVAYAEKYK